MSSKPYFTIPEEPWASGWSAGPTVILELTNQPTLTMNKDKIIFEFPVLWEGWECDSKAWIMERNNGTRYLVMTNHGSEYEAQHQELLDRIQEYESVIDKTRTALKLLELKD